MKRLGRRLRSFLDEKLLVDIFLFGSALKGKRKPGDIDVIALFREKDFERIEDIIYSIKKSCESEGIRLHIEPLTVDGMLSEPVYASILHEGFSIRHGRNVSQLMGLISATLFSYSLEGKTSSEKVRFSYALYGRKAGEGFAKTIGAEEVGRGALMVPIGKAEAAKEFFETWSVKFSERRIWLLEK
jgi:predicted nucleotidyltransferase